MAASASAKIIKPMHHEEKEGKELNEMPSSTVVTPNNSLHAPKHGTVIPNRVFVGGISPSTTENDLVNLFSHYGTVKETKIIADRAGVSKGYGFVTFETEDEARRLQKDADNIVFRERRLNIAPAIKKQGYGRAGYDCGPPTPLPMAAPLMRQNGVTYAFHNGMAFFPQPPPQHIPQAQHVESPVFQQGPAGYGGFAQGNPAPSYPFAAYHTGQVFYQPPQYPYHIPQFDGNYETGSSTHMVMPDGNIVVPQYFIAQAPGHEVAYYQAQQVHSQEQQQQGVAQLQGIVYSPNRQYDQQLVYQSETRGEEQGVQIQEADTAGSQSVTSSAASSEMASYTNPPSVNDKSDSNNNAGKEQETPVVSLLNVYNKEQQKKPQMSMPPPSRRKPQDPRRINNNNNPDMANRNLMYAGNGRGRRGSADFDLKPQHQQVSSSQSQYPGSRTPAPQTQISYPMYPPPQRQHFLPPPHFPSSYYHHSQHQHHSHGPPAHWQRSRGDFYRPRYSGPFGRGGGRGGGGYRGDGGKWLGKETSQQTGANGNQPLTPPVTPKSSELSPAPGHPHQPGQRLAKPEDQLVGAIKAFSI